MAHRDGYRQWPSLTAEEFELACHFFDQNYVRAHLGPSRKILKIRLRRSMTFGQCYIEIIRLLQPPEDLHDLSDLLAKLGGDDGSSMDTAMNTIDEDADMVCGVEISSDENITTKS